MKLMLSFYRAYPLRTLLTLLAMSVAGLAEGVGLSALLPLLNIAMETDQGAAAVLPVAANNAFEQGVRETLAWAGITPDLNNLLLLIVAALTLFAGHLAEVGDDQGAGAWGVGPVGTDCHWTSDLRTQGTAGWRCPRRGAPQIGRAHV